MYPGPQQKEAGENTLQVSYFKGMCLNFRGVVGAVTWKIFKQKAVGFLSNLSLKPSIGTQDTPSSRIEANVNIPCQPLQLPREDPNFATVAWQEQ